MNIENITADQFIKGMLALILLGIILISIGVYVFAGLGPCLIVTGAVLAIGSLIILSAN